MIKDTHWIRHFDSLDDRFELFDQEASDYVCRLQSAISLRRDCKVFDFGCGFGLAAKLLAPHVEQLWLWDTSPNMRQRAQQSVAAFNNTHVLESLTPESQNDLYVDIVLVNSVIQYMSREEFIHWLKRWRSMLRVDGQIVVSDIVPEESWAFSDMVESLVFAARRGFLIRSIRFAFSALARYWRTRWHTSLLSFSQKELYSVAAKTQLAVEFLGTNLTYRKNRVTAIFRRLPAMTEGN